MKRGAACAELAAATAAVAINIMEVKRISISPDNLCRELSP
jgi:hypothetical protein